MSVSLQKGQKVSLTKEKGGLERVRVGLGWDAVEQKSKGFFSQKAQEIDCDASALLLQNGKLANHQDVVYYGNLKHKSNTVIHMGDNLTGSAGGDADDEQITVNLATVPEKYDKIVIVVNIYQAMQRGQHFGMVNNAFIRIMDDKTGEELLKYNLSEDTDKATAMIFGEIYRHNGEWKFAAIGQSTRDPGLKELLLRYS